MCFIEEQVKNGESEMSEKKDRYVLRYSQKRTLSFEGWYSCRIPFKLEEGETIENGAERIWKIIATQYQSNPTGIRFDRLEETTVLGWKPKVKQGS